MLNQTLVQNRAHDRTEVRVGLYVDGTASVVATTTDSAGGTLRVYGPTGDAVASGTVTPKAGGGSVTVALPSLTGDVVLGWTGGSVGRLTLEVTVPAASDVACETLTVGETTALTPGTTPGYEAYEVGNKLTIDQDGRLASDGYILTRDCVIIQSPNLHYWALTVDNSGAPSWTDLGTDDPV